VFPGSEAFLAGRTCAPVVPAASRATGNINAKAIKQVHVRWQEPDAPQLQAAITRRRKIVEAFPLISRREVGSGRQYADPSWNYVRAPLLSLDGARAKQLKERLTQDGYTPAIDAVTL